MDLVREIENLETGSTGAPQQSVIITNCGELKGRIAHKGEKKWQQKKVLIPKFE
jgi:hypothetical protein